MNATDCCYEWMSFFFDSEAAVVGIEPVKRKLVKYIFILKITLLTDSAYELS